MVDKIKPFEDKADGWFRIHNYVFDVCMPRLSNAGWRVLCVAIRKTLGWVATNAKSNMDRKEWDQISYSQFMEMSGLVSPASVSKGLQENIKIGYMKRREIGRHQGTKTPLYAYSLNREFEAEWSGATTESVVEPADHDIAATKSVVAPTAESVAVATTETVDTKEKERTSEMTKEVLSLDLWISTLAALKGMMTKETFDAHLLGSTATQTDGTITVTLLRAPSVAWCDKSLRPRIESTLAHQAGRELQVTFREPTP